MYSPKEAADATGKSKSAILRAIQSGKISAARDENGHFTIDPAELHRVYPPKTSDGAPAQPEAAPERSGALRGSDRLKLDLLHLESRLSDLVAERERERRQAQDTIDDLRARLDREAEQRNQLLGRLLSDDRPKPERPGLFAGWRKRSGQRVA